MLKTLPALIFFIIITTSITQTSKADPNSETTKDDKTARVERAAEAADEITTLRSELARKFITEDTEITPETFKAVCGAVGKRAKQIATEEGFIIRHAALKWRNPKHKARAGEILMMERFEANRELTDITDKTISSAQTIIRVTKPIFVEKACLKCHGAKEKRPAFIKEKYPEDNAYGFKPGDLRGIVSISFITD